MFGMGSAMRAMRAMRRALLIARASARWCSLALLVACGKKNDAPSANVLAPPPTPVVPADHLAPTELVEGKVSALGLILPCDLQLEASIAGLVIANGDLSPEAVANYVRARVTEGTVTVGSIDTRFEGVKVISEPTRALSIRIGPGRGYRCSLQMRDVTPPELPTFNNDADRWRAAGMTPDGRLIDKQKLQ